MEIKTFSELTLPAGLLEDLTRMGFTTPTPIQAATLPAVLGGKDILGIAPTGTGKTGAFGIPAIASLSQQKEKQVLVLAPTRELAAQIFQFFRQMSQKSQIKGALLVGGEPFRRQYMDWNMGVDYMVATPGRLMDHVNQGLDLSHVGILILDEVDRMLDMGFAPQVEQILKGVPDIRQTLLFSATIPPGILKLAARFLKDPVRVTVGANPDHAPKIKEERIRVSRFDKPAVLLEQIKSRTGKILIFARTQSGTNQAAERLEAAGIETAYLHGGRTQAERKRALEAFRTGRVRVMVATDIAARGIDVTDIEVVVNYDYPGTKEDYLHRIGRTGRCGKEGLAITFIDDHGGGGRRAGGERRSFAPRREFQTPGFSSNTRKPGDLSLRLQKGAATPPSKTALRVPKRQVAELAHAARAPRPELKARPESKPRPELKARPEFKPRVESKPRSEFKPRSEPPKARPEFKPRSNFKPRPESKSDPESKPRTGFAPKPEWTARAESKPRKGSKTPGVSGSVRYFRAGEPRVAVPHPAALPPPAKPAKPQLVRSTAGAVRRQKSSHPPAKP